MKKIVITIAFLGFALTASAQNETQTMDRLQQEPPRETQTAVEQAARQAAINEQNNRNVNNAEDKLTEEVERSTGKPKKNPAETNPKTVRPPAITDPLSAPANSGNR